MDGGSGSTFHASFRILTDGRSGSTCRALLRVQHAWGKWFQYLKRRVEFSIDGGGGVGRGGSSMSRVHTSDISRSRSFRSSRPSRSCTVYPMAAVMRCCAGSICRVQINTENVCQLMQIVRFPLRNVSYQTIQIFLKDQHHQTMIGYLSDVCMGRFA